MSDRVLSSIGDDYEALRRGVGARVLERDTVLVHGPDATSYLQGQLSCDVTALGHVGASSLGLLLEPSGKLSALVRVTRTGDDAYVLDTDGGFGETVVVRLVRFKLRTKADVEPLDWPVVGVRGSEARSAPSSPPPFVLDVSWNATEGFDLLGPDAASLAPNGARWVGADAWEALRVEAGIPAMGAELDAKTIAAEGGLVDRTVCFTKGCYTGQELVARLAARGSKVARRLCGVVVREGGGVVRPAALLGATLHRASEDAVVGACTSSAWCPGLGGLAALAYLHRSVELPAVLECSLGDEGRVAVEARTLPLVGG